jgi:hypothetical protein
VSTTLTTRVASLAAALAAALALMLTLNAGSALAANGCGPADWRGRFVPNSPIGFQFGPACNWHDNCYATPWNRVAFSYAAAKDYCDRWFYFKMSQVCAYQGGRTDYQWCQYIAYYYYSAVVRYGANPYRSAQRR